MIGQQIGNYRIEREIPGGGMGRVFVAIQLTLNRTVAVKMLRQELAESDEQVAKFRREADTLARMDHENIVRVFDIVEHEARHFIIMEFVGGPPLGDLMHRAGRLPPAFARDVAADIAGALSAAHGHGIIHRDIKPGNILFTAGGRPKLADFGIARIVDTATSTQSQLVGTPYYMSPEQVRGDVLTAASDVYSLGVVLYEMLAGRVPFDGETAIGVALKHVQEAPPPLASLAPDVPPALCALVGRVLEKDPRRRFDDAEHFQEALQHVDLGVEPGRAVRRLFPGLASPAAAPACAGCGTPLKPGFLTCPRCGRAVGTPPATSVPAPAAAPAAPAAQPVASPAPAPRPAAAAARSAPPAWAGVARRLADVRAGPAALTAAGVVALFAAGGLLVTSGGGPDEAGDEEAPAASLALQESPPEARVSAAADGAVPVFSMAGPTGERTMLPPAPAPSPTRRETQPVEPAPPPRREPPAEPRTQPRPAQPARDERPEPAPPEPARDEKPVVPEPAPAPTPAFDEAAAAREIEGIIERQRRATETGDLQLLLQDLESRLHRDVTRAFRGMHRDAADVSSQITNRTIRFSDPESAQVSFHAVITATRRGDSRRITVADRVVVWRLVRSGGRWLIVSSS